LSGDFLAAPRAFRRWRLPIIVLVVLLAGVAAFWANRTGASQSGSGAPRATPTSAANPTPSDAPQDAEPLRLVPGDKTVDGVRVGYPRSTVGAVSAAIEYWTQLGSTLDPDRARRIGGRVAARSWKDAADELAQGPVNTRRQLSLPTKGALPAGASISLGPVAYQVRDAKATSMTVLVLAYLITTTPTDGTVSRLGVFPAPMRWDDDDWRLAADERHTDYRRLQTTPGSAEAAAAGWLEFQQ
jgi:hypothetical protein